MNQWLDQLRADRDRLRINSLLRGLTEVSPAGPMLSLGDRSFINLAGNDYLGLSQHPHLRAAAVAAIQAHGVGSGASRLVTGHHPLHAQLEERFARFKHAPAALLCPTGFVANLAAVTALAGPGDLVCVDKLNHASLLDAARSSGATVRAFPHLNYDKLRRLLERWRNGASRTARALIVTDSVFSMDGDVADLPWLCDLADQFDAILVVDEAHGTGVLGENGSGLCEAQDVAERVDVVISTASKALGSLGGLVTGPREVIDTLVNRARPFIYTTAAPPAQAATIAAALDVIRDEPWRRLKVRDMSRRLRERLSDIRWLPQILSRPRNIPQTPPRDSIHAPAADGTLDTPIIPLIVGTERRALRLAEHLRSCGLFAPAIRPPTVAPGASRVRLSLRADLPDDVPDRILSALAAWNSGTD